MSASTTRRNTRGNPKHVPGVESQHCPDEPVGGTHLLTADRYARITCVWCKSSWSSLDAVVREGL